MLFCYRKQKRKPGGEGGSISDNYGGHRRFTGEGWKDGKLVLTMQQQHPKGGTPWQHFLYEKLSASLFNMTCEASKDGITWRMVDYLVFPREQV